MLVPFWTAPAGMRENAQSMAAEDDTDDVLSRLPKTRPARRSAHRAATPTSAPPARPASKTKPKSAARPTARPAPKTRPKATAKKPGTTRPKAATQAATPQPPAEPTPTSARGPIEPPSGSEILQTAVQAAGDIAHVGLLIGREALKAARSRLPGGR